jgi:hypothetical protein
MADIPDVKSMIAEIDSKIGHPNFFPTEVSCPKKNVPLEFEQRDLTVKDAVVVLDIDETLVGSFDGWKSGWNTSSIERIFEMVHEEGRDDLFDLMGALYTPYFGSFDLLRMLRNRNIRFCFFSSGIKTRNYNLVRWLLHCVFGEEEGKKVWDSVSVFSREDMCGYTSSKDLKIVIGLNEENRYCYSRDPEIIKAYLDAESKSKILIPWIVLADDRCSSSKSEQKESFLHVFDPRYTYEGPVGENSKGMGIDELFGVVGNDNLRVVYLSGVIDKSISLLSNPTPSSPQTFSAAAQKVVKRYTENGKKFEEYEKIIMRGLCALKQIEYEKGKEEEEMEEMEGSERGRRRIRREKTRKREEKNREIIKKRKREEEIKKAKE